MEIRDTLTVSIDSVQNCEAFFEQLGNINDNFLNGKDDVLTTLVDAHVKSILNQQDNLPLETLQFPKWFIQSQEKSIKGKYANEERIDDVVFKTERRINFQAGVAEKITAIFEVLLMIHYINNVSLQQILRNKETSEVIYDNYLVKEVNRYDEHFWDSIQVKEHLDLFVLSEIISFENSYVKEVINFKLVQLKQNREMKSPHKPDPKVKAIQEFTQEDNAEKCKKLKLQKKQQEAINKTIDEGMSEMVKEICKKDIEECRRQLKVIKRHGEYDNLSENNPLIEFFCMASFERLFSSQNFQNFDHFSVYFAESLEKLLKWKPQSIDLESQVNEMTPLLSSHRESGCGVMDQDAEYHPIVSDEEENEISQKKDKDSNSEVKPDTKIDPILDAKVQEDLINDLIIEEELALEKENQKKQNKKNKKKRKQKKIQTKPNDEKSDGRKSSVSDAKISQKDKDEFMLMKAKSKEIIQISITKSKDLVQSTLDALDSSDIKLTFDDSKISRGIQSHELEEEKRKRSTSQGSNRSSNKRQKPHNFKSEKKVKPVNKVIESPPQKKFDITNLNIIGEDSEMDKSKVKKSSSTVRKTSDHIKFAQNDTTSEVGSEQFIMVKRITSEKDNRTESTAEEGTASSKKHNLKRKQRTESAKRDSPRKTMAEEKMEESVSMQQAESNRNKNKKGRKKNQGKVEATSDTETVPRDPLQSEQVKPKKKNKKRKKNQQRKGSDNQKGNFQEWNFVTNSKNKKPQKFHEKSPEPIPSKGNEISIITDIYPLSDKESKAEENQKPQPKKLKKKKKKKTQQQERESNIDDFMQNMLAGNANQNSRTAKREQNRTFDKVQQRKKTDEKKQPSSRAQNQRNYLNYGVRSQKTSKNRNAQKNMGYQISKEILNEAIDEEISQFELRKLKMNNVNPLKLSRGQITEERGSNFDRGTAQFTQSSVVYQGEFAKNMTHGEMKLLKDKETGLIETPRAQPGQFLTHFDYSPAEKEFKDEELTTKSIYFNGTDTEAGVSLTSDPQEENKSEFKQNPEPYYPQQQNMLDFQNIENIVTKSNSVPLNNMGMWMNNYTNPDEMQMYQAQQLMMMKWQQHEYFMAQLNDGLVQNQISVDTQLYNMAEARNSVRRVIEEVAKSTFGPHVTTFMYGSLEQGIGLQTSDLDIAIKGLNLPDHSSVSSQESHQLVHSQLSNFKNESTYQNQAIVQQQHDSIINQQRDLFDEISSKLSYCIKEIKNIDSASVPVIKILIEVNKLPLTIALTDEYCIEVDLTLLDREIALTQSIQFVRYNVDCNIHLKPAILFIKKLLLTHQLNDLYTGGVSSYSLMIMLLCSSAQIQMGEPVIPSSILKNFFLFYMNLNTYEYEIRYDGVQPRRTGEFMNSAICVIDPNDEENNTTKGSFKADQVINLFRNCYNYIISAEYNQNMGGEQALEAFYLLAA